MKKIISIILVFCALFLSSCGKLLTLNEDRNRGLQLVENFCNELVDDIEKAKEYLHPFAYTTKDRLELFLSKIEKNYDIDFSNGIEIIDSEPTGFSLNDISYYGNAYTFMVKLIVSNKIIIMSFVVVDNNRGYGIHSFAIIE